MKKLLSVVALMTILTSCQTFARKISAKNRTPIPIYVELENSTQFGNCYFHFDGPIPPTGERIDSGTGWECAGACYKYVWIQIQGNPTRLRYEIPSGIGYRQECGDQYVVLDGSRDVGSDWYTIFVGVSAAGPKNTFGFSYNPKTGEMINQDWLATGRTFSE